MKNPHLDAACAVAHLALGGGPPPEGVSQPAPDVICVRRANRLAVLFRPWQWCRQSLSCFGTKALTVAVMDSDAAASLARICIVIDLAKKPGARHRLVSYSIPGRACARFSDTRLPRANLEVKSATEMKSYGMKRARPGRAAKFAMEAVA